MPEVIALFPLSHVLLPGIPLPLHIFEPRYKQMLRDIADAPSAAAFGVVALRSGTEALNPALADTDPDVEPIGTLAEILEIAGDHLEQADATADLLCVGSRRFRIHRLLPDGKPYLRGEVEYLDEPDGALTPEQETRARDLLDVYDAILVKLAGRGTGSELPGDANLVSYQIAARLPLDPGERQELLADETTADRLVRVARLLRREIALLQNTRSIAVSPAVLRMATGSS